MAKILDQLFKVGSDGIPINLPVGIFDPSVISTQELDDGKFLRVTDGIAQWQDLTIDDIIGDAVWDAAHGGTGISEYTRGDLLVAEAPTELGVISVSGGGQALFSDTTLDLPAYRLIIANDVNPGTFVAGNYSFAGSIITAGTWHGGVIGTLYGGTGLSTFTAAGRLLYSTSASALATLAFNTTATNNYLQSVSSGNPSWQQVAFSDLSGNITYDQLPTGSGTWDPGVSSNIIRMAAHLRLDSHLGIQAAPSNLRGIDAEVALSGTAGSVESGMLLSATFTDTQGVPSAGYGWQIFNVTSASAFTLVDMRGIMINTPSLGAGSAVTTSYAIYIDTQTGAGTNWAIFTVGSAKSKFGGDIISLVLDSGAASDLVLKRNGTAIMTLGAALVTLAQDLKFANAATGVGTAGLGTNSPAGTLTQPYTWLRSQAPDGSTVYTPCWK